MSEFYATLQAQAYAMATPEAPLATAPVFSVSRRLTDVGANFALDLDTVIDVAEQHGKDPRDLGALAVYMYDSGGTLSGGGFHNKPVCIEGRIHYPVVGIGVDDPLKLDLAVINRRFRHEFCHIMQEDLTDPLYARPWFTKTVQVASICAVIEATSNLTETIMGWPYTSTWASLGFLAMLPSIAPKQSIALATPREIDANYFALKNKNFAPIALVE